MKHAILITAYKNFNQLLRLINEFDENFNIYIHIDKKSRVKENILVKIKNHSNVKHVSSLYKVNWASINHLKSCLYLAEISLKNLENQYFHLITGQDFPIKSNDYFHKLLSESEIPLPSYLEYVQLPYYVWGKYGGKDRFDFFHFYNLFNTKSSFQRSCNNFLVNTQSFFGFKRKSPNINSIYGGSTYWTLTRDLLQYVIEYRYQNPDFLRRLNFTFCPEEMYIPTIIMNSEFSKNVINNNLRYIDWETKRGGHPAILDESDYESIINSEKLFARKVDNSTSQLGYLLSKYRNNPVK